MGALIIWAYLFINYSSVGWQCLYCGWTNGYAHGQPGIKCWVEVAQLALISSKNPHQSCLLIVYTRLSWLYQLMLGFAKGQVLDWEGSLGITKVSRAYFLISLILVPWGGRARKEAQRETDTLCAYVGSGSCRSRHSFTCSRSAGAFACFLYVPLAP
jgi:hypothetical protein